MQLKTADDLQYDQTQLIQPSIAWTTSTYLREALCNHLSQLVSDSLVKQDEATVVFDFVCKVNDPVRPQKGGEDERLGVSGIYNTFRQIAWKF
jgi:hypothetical protein